MPALDQETEISGGIKCLEEGRDKQATNRENMHRNQDDSSSWECSHYTTEMNPNLLFLKTSQNP